MRSNPSLRKLVALTAAIAVSEAACGEDQETTETQDAGPQVPATPQEKVLGQSDLYRRELKERCLGVINGGDRFMVSSGIWGEMDLQVGKDLPDGTTEFCQCDRSVSSVFDSGPSRPDRGVCDYFLVDNENSLLRMEVGVNAHSNFPPESGATACVRYVTPEPPVEGERCPTDDPCVTVRVTTPEDEARMRQGERISDTGDSLSYVTDEDTGRCGIMRSVGACVIFQPDSLHDVSTDIASCRADFAGILADIDEVIAAGQNLPIEFCDEHFRDRCQNPQ